MNKKVFFSGVATGAVSVIVAVAGVNFTANALAFGGNRFTMSDKISYINAIIENYYVDDYEQKQLEEGIYKGFVEGLGDPYSNYFSKEEMDIFMESTSGSFCGIGVNIQYNEETGKILVISPIAGSPAEKAGMKPGDLIYKVNGRDITGMDIDSSIGLIKGEAGTTVSLTLSRDGKDVDINVKREEIELDSVGSKVMDGGIGYIYISGFKSNTHEQFAQHYEKLRKQNIKGLVIDVRDNPGGVLSVVEEMADMLIPEGIVVYTIDKEGNRVDYNSDANSIDIPLAVLVNGNSASASEILAGAVQDSGTGVLVGTQTYGKGCVQNLYKIPDGSGVKVTIQKYYTPNGVCIQGTGIKPDYVVENDDKYKFSSVLLIEPGEDKQLNKALEVVKEKIKNKK